VELFAPVGDAMVAVAPDRELVDACAAAARTRLPVIGQQPVSWGPDADGAAGRAHELFRWFAGGWKVNSELPGPAGFAAATRFVRPQDVRSTIPCGPDVAAHVEAVRPFVEAGYSHVALAQVGGETQPEFLDFARTRLLPALREEFGASPDPAVRVRLG